MRVAAPTNAVAPSRNLSPAVPYTDVGKEQPSPTELTCARRPPTRSGDELPASTPPSSGSQRRLVGRPASIVLDDQETLVAYLVVTGVFAHTVTAMRAAVQRSYRRRVTNTAPRHVRSNRQQMMPPCQGSQPREAWLRREPELRSGATKNCTKTDALRHGSMAIINKSN